MKTSTVLRVELTEDEIRELIVSKGIVLPDEPRFWFDSRVGISTYKLDGGLITKPQFILVIDVTGRDPSAPPPLPPTAKRKAARP